MRRPLSPGQRFLGLAALVAVLGVGARIGTGDPQRWPTGTVVGTVLRGGHPAAARVALHATAEIDPADPYAAWRNFAYWTDRLRAAAAVHSPVATASADAKGRFRFEGVPLGPYEVHAIAGDGARAADSLVVPAAGAVVEAQVDLSVHPVSLSGRVVDADGKPFHGWVELSPRRREWYEPKSRASAVRTGDDGGFVFEGQDRGDAALTVTVPDRMRFCWGIVHLPSAHDILVQVPAGTPLHGRVVDEETGRGVSGADVVVQSGPLLARTESGQDGGFDVMPPESRAQVVANAPGYAPAGIDLRDADPRPVVLRLRRPARLVGRLVREGGEPVSGVDVYAFDRAAWDLGAEYVPSVARSDELGRFEIETSGTVDVMALGHGWISAQVDDVGSGSGYDPLSIELEPGQTTEVLLEVVPTGRVEGTVRDANGRPVAGASVRPRHRSWAMATARFSWGIPAWVTDGAGRFTLDALLSRRADPLEVRAAGHGAFRSEAFPVAAGETRRMEIVLPAERTVPVRVLSAEGSPIEDARVESPGEGATARTDREGRARLGPLGLEELVIEAVAPGFLRSASRVAEEGSDRREAPEVTLRLQRGRSLRGRAVLPDGRLARTVEIGWTHMPRHVDADGTFGIEDLPSYPTEVSVAAYEAGRRFEGRTTVAADASDLTVLLSPASSDGSHPLRVSVVGPDGGPVNHGLLSLDWFEAERSGGDFSSFEGGIGLLRVPDAKGWMWVAVYGVGDEALGAAVVGPVEATRDEVEVRLGPARTITGTLQAPDGGDLKGSRVEALPVVERLPPSGHLAHATVRTDSRGRFVLRGLGAGTYALRVVPPPRYVVDPVVVEAVRSDVTVDLVPASRPVLRVEDAEGRPVEGAEVLVEKVEPGADHPSLLESRDRHVRGWLSHATTDATGAARLSPLDPRTTFHLRVRPPPEREDLLGLERDAWPPKDEVLRLERLLRVRGRVVDASGRPLPAADVEYTRAGLEAWQHETAEVEKDGSFEINRLKAGDVSLRVVIDGAPREFRAPWQVTVPAGTSDVLLRAPDPGASMTIHVDPWNHRANRASLRWPDGRRASARLDDEGRATFRGVVATERYLLWISEVQDDHYVLERDLAPTSEEVVVPIRRGKSIRGRFGPPEGVDRGHYLVRARSFPEGLDAPGHVSADGAFEVSGLPDGDWEVEGSLFSGGVWYRAKAKARAGEEDLHLPLAK